MVPGVTRGEINLEHAITAQGLVKRYGTVVALDGLDLDVPEATVLGLLGPNGAGKTTAIRIFTTLLQPEEGRRRCSDSMSSPRPLGSES